MCVEKECHRTAKLIVNKKTDRTLIALGSTQIHPRSPMKGHVRLPNKTFIKALRTRADVMLTNEYRTSKVCSGCFQLALTPKNKKHRYVSCRGCASTNNRDVNAGRNILYIGLWALRGRKKNKIFKK